MMGEAVSITKALRLRENLHMRFGVDAYNVLNRHAWRSSGDGVTSASFGLVQPF
jgi:hypothetical protein